MPQDCRSQHSLPNEQESRATRPAGMCLSSFIWYPRGSNLTPRLFVLAASWALASCDREYLAPPHVRLRPCH